MARQACADYVEPPASELVVALVAEHAPVADGRVPMAREERMHPTWQTSWKEKAFFSYDASCLLVELN